MKLTDLQGELERLHPASFGWALWCCDHRREEAEEVLQTAYVKVLDETARFNGNASLRTWFFSVIRRTAEAAASGSESASALRKALADLPARQRDVLHLVFYQDLTVEEASRILEISLGTARTHFERGKAQLRKVLAQQEVAQ